LATAVVAAAGAGERLGAGTPKALVELAGRPMVTWCLVALEACERVQQAVIAAPPGFEDEISAVAAEAAPGLPTSVATGGATRSESVSNAIRSIDPASELVIHDAARPLATPALFDRCIERLEHWDCDGVVAAARAVDTIKEADAGGRVIATLERGTLWVVQTPQVFQAGALMRAVSESDLTRATDDAQLVEAVGGDIRLVEAPRHNLKVTNELDLRIAELLLGDRL
jgi:2-C-methyl-D-erythritol 4-phosphate cytidylyltransferase